MVDKRPIFQHIIMWVAVILSAHLHASPEKTEQSHKCASVSVCVSVRRIFPLTLSDSGVWRFVVPPCVGCGHPGSVKVISCSFSPNVSPHVPFPQHVSVSRVGPLVPRSQTALSLPGNLSLVHSSALSRRRYGVGASGSSDPSPFPLAPHPTFAAACLTPLSVC